MVLERVVGLDLKKRDSELPEFSPEDAGFRVVEVTGSQVVIYDPVNAVSSSEGDVAEKAVVVGNETGASARKGVSFGEGPQHIICRRLVYFNGVVEDSRSGAEFFGSDDASLFLDDLRDFPVGPNDGRAGQKKSGSGFRGNMVRGAPLRDFRKQAHDSIRPRKDVVKERDVHRQEQIASPDGRMFLEHGVSESPRGIIRFLASLDAPEKLLPRELSPG